MFVCICPSGFVWTIDMKICTFKPNVATDAFFHCSSFSSFFTSMYEKHFAKISHYNNFSKSNFNKKLICDDDDFTCPHCMRWWDQSIVLINNYWITVSQLLPAKGQNVYLVYRTTKFKTLKLVAFADYKIDVTGKMKFVFGRVEKNIV